VTLSGGPGGGENVAGRGGSAFALIIYTIASTRCAVNFTVTVNPLPSNIAGNIPFCGGTTLLLTDPGGGTWSSSNTVIASFASSTSGNVTGGGTSGTSLVTYTLPTGCITTTTVSVNLQPPAVITPVGDTNLCPGGFVELTANTGPGLTYQWSRGAGVIPGATNSTYNTGALFSTDSFTVTVANGCSRTSPWMHVSVNPAPVFVTGTPTGCSVPGDTLKANTAPGLSYQWLSGGSIIPGAVDSYYVATTTGIYSLIETSRAGCSATSFELGVTITTSPPGLVTVSGPLTFCMGDSVTFTGDAGYTYQWYDGAAVIPGANGRTYSATTSGSYFLTETNALGCSTSSPSVIVNAIALPPASIIAAGPTIFCIGSNVSLSTFTAAGLTFQWFDDGGAIPGANTSTYIASTLGSYTVRVTSTATGCSATSLATPVAILSTPDIIPLSSTVFCLGGSSHLSVTFVSGVGAVTYQWLLDGSPILGATANNYVATVPGNYTNQVTISGAGGCSETSVATIVKENPLPNPVVSYNDNTLYTQTYFRSYLWYFDLSPITHGTTYSTPAVGNGAYKVEVTDSNGCQSVSPAYPLSGWHNTTNVGSVTSGNGDIKIYPNPAQTLVHIESAVQVRAVLSSMDGKSVIDQAAATDINISNLADGIYMITLYDGNDHVVKTEKLVKAAN